MDDLPKGRDLADLLPKGALMQQAMDQPRRVAMTYAELKEFAAAILAAAPAPAPAPVAQQEPTDYKLVPITPTTEIICAIEREIDNQCAASGVTQVMHRQDGQYVWDAAIAAAAPVAAPADADPNAPWLSLAHMICSDAGIPPGHITARLEALRDKIDAPVAAPAEQGERPIPERSEADREMFAKLGGPEFSADAVHAQWSAQGERKPVAWCFRKSLVQHLQWHKPIGGDNVLRHWTPLYE